MSTDPHPTKTSAEAATRKFLFPESFALPHVKAAQEKEKPKPIYTEEQMVQAKEASFAQGFAEGNKTLMDEEFIRLRHLMLNIERHLNQLTMAGMDIWQNQLAEMQEVALVIARKILPAYTKKYGAFEIEAILDRIVSDMAHEPRLVVRVSPENFDVIDEKLNEITAQKAYAGKVIVLSDEEFSESDCRVEWADGGIDRDLKTLWFDIDRIIEEGTGLETAALSKEDTVSVTPERTVNEAAPTEDISAEETSVPDQTIPSEAATTETGSRPVAPEDNDPTAGDLV